MHCKALIMHMGKRIKYIVYSFSEKYTFQILHDIHFVVITLQLNTGKSIRNKKNKLFTGTDEYSILSDCIIRKYK